MKREELYYHLLETNDAFACSSPEKQKEFLDQEMWKYIKKIQKQQKYFQAKKEWKIKEKNRTIEKIVFWIECLVKRYGQNYHAKKLYFKLGKKIQDKQLLTNGIKEAHLRKIFSEKAYLKNKIITWKAKWFSQKGIIQKFIQDWYFKKEKIQEALNVYFDSQKSIKTTLDEAMVDLFNNEEQYQNITFLEQQDLETQAQFNKIKNNNKSIQTKDIKSWNDISFQNWKINLNNSAIAFIKKTILKYKLTQLWKEYEEAEKEGLLSNEEIYKLKWLYFSKKQACLWALSRKWWTYNDVKSYFENIESGYEENE